MAKIVLIQSGPNGEIALQRAHREVELLSAVDSRHVVKVLTDAVEIGDPAVAAVHVAIDRTARAVQRKMLTSRVHERDLSVD